MRTLLITQSLPWPLRRNGGAQRTELLRRALRRMGEVDIVGVGGDERLDSDDDRRLARELDFIKHFDVMSGPRPTVRAPWPLKSLLFQREDWARRYRRDPRIVDWISEQQRGPKSYDLIVGRYLKAAAKAGLAEPVNVFHVPTILDFDDIDHHLFRSQREADPWPGTGGRLAMKMVGRQLEQLSLHAPTRFGATWVCSEEDAEAFDAGRGISVLPNVPFDERAAPLPPDVASKTILFVGDLTFPSNRDGVARFVADVWPLIHARVPEAKLDLAGKVDPDDVNTRFAAPGVRVLGYVDDLADAYRRCAFTVAPIWTGGGTKIKVVESLSLGRACATTTHCLRGYGPLVRAGVLSGTDDAQSMVEACIELLGNIAHRVDLASRGAVLAREHYSFDTFAQIVERTVRSLVRTPSSAPETALLSGGAS